MSEGEEKQYHVQYIDENPEETKWIKREGRVKISYPNGDTFEGTINSEKLKHGNGKYCWMEAIEGENEMKEIGSYEGEYKLGKKDGIGKMIFPSGDSYHGNWKNDVMHGEGSYLYLNGDIYSGHFENGIKSGKGTYEFVMDKSKITGTWVAGNITDGKWEFEDGGNYTGHFNQGKLAGKGVFHFQNGLSQEGEYIKMSTDDTENPNPLYSWEGGLIKQTCL